MIVRDNDEIIRLLSPLQAKHNSREFKVIYKLFDLMFHRPEEEHLIDAELAKPKNIGFIFKLIDLGYLRYKQDEHGNNTSIVVMTPKGNELYFKMHDIRNLYMKNKIFDRVI